MFIERAEFPVVEGKEEELAAVIRDKALAILAAAPGCASVKAGRGVEDPGKFILVLEWDRVESHTDFTKTDEFGEFVGLVRPYFAGPSNMEHFKMV